VSRAATNKVGSSALARVPKGVLGTHREAGAIDAALRAAAERCILVSPTTTAEAVPEGVAVAVSAILVDVGRETYKLGRDDDGQDKLGLGGPVLYRAAAAAGVRWDPTLSCRLDDGSDPRYCRWRAVGYVQHFDGALESFVGEKEVDMRPGSPQVEQIIERCAAKIRRNDKDNRLSKSEVRRQAEDRAEGQIRQVLLHVQSHAETKAQLRAIRKRFGLRHGYSRAELQRKPIVAVRPIYTGDSDDPQTRRENAAAVRGAFLGGTQALFGQPVLPAPAPTPRVAPPPPVGQSDPDSGQYDVVVDERTGEVHQVRPAAEPPVDENLDDDLEDDDDDDRDEGPRFPPFGRMGGEPISAGSDSDLAFYARVLRGSIEDPDKARFRSQNQADLAAIEDELARRGDGA